MQVPTMKSPLKRLGFEIDNDEVDHQHLVPRDDGWALQRTTADRASFTFERKEEALVKAVEVARNQGTVLVIHGRDGRIQEQRDYS